MVLAATKRYTATEYLALEDKAEFKSEFINGEIIPMAGASANHNKIALNLCRLLPLVIGNQTYEIFMSDMRLWLPEYSRYTYPDVMVVAGEPIFVDQKQMEVTNPCLIVEILSGSTQAHDHDSKFRQYRSIPSFQEYILVYQNGYEVDHYVKESDDRWILTTYRGESAVIKLSSIQLEISLRDLYRRVTFD
ncbi:Uma2 family endonuclease [Pseudanabaena sp. FACHB-1277]|jgi:Uma2 family endonuclease|uniref:Uma2 family endonuclease n=1 Tax=Pseudanabaena cinerea FACHB-1277 TaxID=2949581 RepID=A0A926Z4J0_9CYAN|nr:Uma2 family endonuclease [Pseudanabaena cinerea]MBD2148608.1 Uma2 family endonuclease [Pseudanabaena cinerea FACHB-1277]